MKIYFTIDDPALLEGQDRLLRRYCGWHWWQQTAGDTYFGVAMPFRDSTADTIVDLLTSLGADVLPSLTDPDSPVPDKVKNKLKKHGVNPADKTRDIAKKLHGKSGFPPLKPSYY